VAMFQVDYVLWDIVNKIDGEVKLASIVTKILGIRMVRLLSRLTIWRLEVEEELGYLTASCRGPAALPLKHEGASERGISEATPQHRGLPRVWLSVDRSRVAKCD